MSVVLAGVVVLLFGGLAALVCAGSARRATAFGVGGATLACACGLGGAVPVLLGAAPQSLRANWEVPFGSFHVRLDALSALFLVSIFVLSALAAIYGGRYLMAHAQQRSLGPPWFFFSLLVASMVMVVVAHNGVLFLVAWEVMSLASFFLVTFEDEEDSTRAAGWVYLVATHLGTAFLLAFFILAGQASGSLDFDRLGPANRAGLLFILALVGFGTKAGFMPLHVWLPEAHPAAPSHVSAVMSGVMIKTGIYGLVRTMTIIGPPQAWWGWALIGIGVTSGVLGVLFALAQHNIKRLLAYSSVENVGIIALGLGLGVVGLTSGLPALAVLGFAGGLLHVVNHAVFKGLLFLGAGAVIHGTGTGEIDRLGGLLKRMPRTGTTFLVAAAAICGLPPLNGFVGEVMIYMAAFGGVISPTAEAAVPSLAVVAGLALIGGLAAACFAKAFGIMFLGEPRSDGAAHTHESPPAMLAPMACLAVLCVLLGILCPLVVGALGPAVAQLSAMSASDVRAVLGPTVRIMCMITAVAIGLLVVSAGLALVRRRLLAGRAVGETVTWDCGYAAPSPRMQYTASSLAQPLTDLFKMFLRTRKRVALPQGLFPAGSSLETSAPDVFQEGVYRRVLAGILRLVARLRWIQHGRLQLYVLYIALTLVALLVWMLE